MTGIQEQVEQRSDNMELARHFLAQSNQQADQGQVAQAVAAAQAAVDILHRFQPPAERKAEYQRLLAEALHKVVQRLIQAGHAGDAAPSAHEAVQMYRQAAGISTGDPVLKIAEDLLTLSQRVADIPLPTEAVTAAQTAVDILHRFQPPAERKAEYQRLLAEALHKVVQRLIQAGHAGDAAPSAHEAVQMYRQAAGISTGDPVLKIAEDLLTLSQRVADIPLPTEAVTAAQTAVDILHEIQVPPGHEAQYLSLLVATLRTLAQRLTQAGGPEEAT